MARVYSQQFLRVDGAVAVYEAPESALVVLRDLTVTGDGSGAGGVARVYDATDGSTYILVSLDAPELRSSQWTGRLVLPAGTHFGLQANAGVGAVLSGYLLSTDD